MVSSDNAFELNTLAKEAQGKGDTINGTIGMAYTDEGRFPENAFLRKAFSRHNEDIDFSYDKIGGEAEFHRLLLTHFFKDELNGAGHSSIATMGGTGSLFLAFSLERKFHEKAVLLLPNIAWSNTERIASLHFKDFAEYNLLKDDHFDLPALKINIENRVAAGNHVVLLLNEPCHNPTGYCMENEEWDELEKFLQEEEIKGKVSLIFDLAYFDFASEKRKRRIVRFFKSVQEFAVVHLCLSCSKSFSFYGLRVGELIILGKDDHQREAMYKEGLSLARGTWSNPNHPAINSIIEALSSIEGKEDLESNIQSTKELVEKRADAFLRKAKELNIPIYPYKEGFFLSIRCENSADLAASLAKEGIFLTPMGEKVLRIALCSVTSSQIDLLAEKIKKCL